MSLSAADKRWLVQDFGPQVRFEEPMSRHTYMRVGGPAEALVTPLDRKGLEHLVRGCAVRGLPWMVVGGGSNLLVRDGGICGVVIKLNRCLRGIRKTGSGEECRLTAQAGVKLQSLCRFSARNGMKGMNFAVGIPGTVGGAIIMNAGTRLGCMADVIESIGCLLPDGQMTRLDRKELFFDYRLMRWPEGLSVGETESPIVMDGRFRLMPGNPKDLADEAEAIRKTRSESQPLDRPNAGCFFKNPVKGRTAGELIDQAGLKGRGIGGALVSNRHANFIVNRGKASAGDILALMALIQRSVFDLFQIDLEPEVKIVGHETD